MTNYKSELKKIKKNPAETPLVSIISEKTIMLIPAEITTENVLLISKWRKKYSDFFLTKFKVSYSGTKNWLNEIWSDQARILFLIIYDDRKIGHIGIHKYDEKSKKAEIDSVLRAEHSKKIPIMEKVLTMMFEWMFKDLKLAKIKLEVFSDNYKAINLYERANMLTVYSKPLKKITTKDGWIWKSTKKSNQIAERYLNIMEINRDRFYLKT